MTQKRWSRYVGIAAGVGVIAVVLTSTTAGPAIAQTFKPVMSFIINDANNPVPVRSVNDPNNPVLVQTVGPNLTHVGRPAADLVTLVWFSNLDCFAELSAADPPEHQPTCFVPASGHTAIITDVHWHEGTPGLPPGAHCVFTLGTPARPLLFMSSAVVASNLVAFNAHHLQTGFVFHPSLRPSPDGTVILHGYVVPSE